MDDDKKYIGGSPSVLNELNVSAVLDKIRSEVGISRSGLKKSLKLSFPTISRTVNTLIEKEYVIETGYGESSGGKKPKMLKFNSDKYYVIGIAIDINFIDIILSDLSGNEKKSTNNEFLKEKKPSYIIDTIIEYIEKIIDESGINKEKLEVIAIGIPGIVEKETGLVKLIPTIPSWEGLNLSKILFEKIGIKILVDNMSNMSLLAERQQGMTKGYNNVVYIGIGTGIGSGILINGKIYRGFNGSAGEIGYMFIDRNLDKKIFYPQGQFEYLASETTLRSIIYKACKENANNCEFKSDFIIKLIDDPKNRKQVLDIIDNFAYGVTNIISILNPELIIIEDSLFEYSDKAFDYLVQKVKQLSIFKTKIIRSILGKKSISLGAVILGIKYLDKKIFSPLFL